MAESSGLNAANKQRLKTLLANAGVEGIGDSRQLNNVLNSVAENGVNKALLSGLTDQLEAVEAETLSDEQEYQRRKADMERQNKQHQHKRFDSGTEVDFYHEDGQDHFLIKPANGNAFCITAPKDSDSVGSVLSDGTFRMTDKNNGTSMDYKSLGNQGFLDASNFRPTNSEAFMKATPTGKQGFRVHSDGRISANVVGQAQANTMFIQTRDGGIRTIDGNDNIVLADEKNLPKDIGKEALQKHRAFAAAAKENPELINDALAKTPERMAHQAGEQVGQAGRAAQQNLAEAVREMKEMVGRGLDSRGTTEKPVCVNTPVNTERQQTPSNVRS